jgi:hypothetical protein
MNKRGCWDDEKDEKWIKDSQKMVCCIFVLISLCLFICLGDGSICQL